jgi:prepilin-type N-terminal cleavage/methylation domain-containing protein
MTWHLSRSAGRNSLGFTLIELLIVIAILAILSASSMMIITAPMTEAARATTAQVNSAAETRLFLALTQDAHEALRASGDDSALTFETDETSVTYLSQPDGTILRKASSFPDQVHRFQHPARLRLETPPDQSKAYEVRVVFESGGPASIPHAVPAEKQNHRSKTMLFALRPAILGSAPREVSRP